MAVASSTFDGSENPLSEGGVWDTPTGADPMQKITGAARGTVVGLLNMARRVTPTIGPNQYSKIIIESSTPDFPAACTRMQSGSAICYMAEVNGSSSIEIIRMESVSLNILGAAFTISPALVSGDEVELQSRDSYHYLYVNGVLQGFRFDATYTSGQPGIRNESATAADGILAWEGGDLPANIEPNFSLFPKQKLR